MAVFFFFQEGNRILSRKKLALKKRSFVNLYNTDTVDDCHITVWLALPEIRGHPIVGLAKIFHNSINWMCTFSMGINVNNKLPII